MIMIGNAWQDQRVLAIAGRAAKLSSDTKTAGMPEGRAALRQLLAEISGLLEEPVFYKEG